MSLIILLFEPALQQINPIFGYFDELATLSLGSAALIKLSLSSAKTQCSKWRNRTILCLLALAVLGLLGIIFSDLRPSPIAVAIDMLSCFKFFIAFGAVTVLFDDTSSLLYVLVRLARILVVVLFLLACVNLFFDLGMRGEVRYGIASFKFLFFHPGIVVWFTVALTALLLTYSKNNRIYVFLALVVVCLTLRSKGICWAAVIIVFLLSSGKNNGLKIWHVLIALLAVIYLSYDSVQLYYNNESIETARAALQRVSFDVANDYFPWGSGYASFGSAITADPEYYSPLYYAYGLSAVWGITPSYPEYISDSFWPTVIAQFGWMGVVLFVSALLCLLAFVRGRLKGKAPMLWIASLSLFAYLLLGSIAESSFFNPSAVYFAVILAIILNCPSAEKTAPSDRLVGDRK